MFGIGVPEMLVILAVALIVVGPDKLPELAKSLAKTLSELKQSAEELKAGFNGEESPKKLLDDLKPDLEDVAQTFQETLLDLPQNNIPQPTLNQKDGDKQEDDRQPDPQFSPSKKAENRKSEIEATKSAG